MKTLKTILIILVTFAVLVFVAFFLIGFLKPKPAGILVEASPTSSVYVNGVYAGRTPLKKTLEAGTVSIKLVPQVSDQDLIPFETNVSLTPGIETIVRRELGKSEDDSAHDIISYEKGEGKSAGLIVVSTPDNAQVSVDGVPRGFAPYKTSSISPAAHQIAVKAPGYIDRSMTLNTRAGYRLTLFVKLAKSSDSPLSASPTPTPAPQIMVLILDTPTGYLRVRSEPGTKGEEIGQVKPGEKFLFLETDAETGWIKIRFQEPKAGLPNGFAGWVSNQYAEVINEETPSSPAPSPAATPEN